MAKRSHGPPSATHLLGLLSVTVGLLLLLPVQQTAALIDGSLAPTFSLVELTGSADYVNCKDAVTSFDEPCRCYRSPKNISNGALILDCDEVAFQFFPPVPSNETLLMASFRNIGYQGLPTELFRGRGTDLRALDLSNNHLLSITTSSLSGLENSLQFLNLSGNSLGRNFQPLLDIPEIHRLRMLKVLDLSENGIKLISDQFFSGLTDTLEEIFLRDNDLTDIQFLSSAQNLIHLRVMDLSGNRIFRLESLEFSSLPALQFLDLQNNFISMMLPNSFNGTSLKTLNLGRNRMQAIDSVVFGGLESSLQDLDLPFNVLQKVPNLAAFVVLERLNFSSNIISNFNDDLQLPVSIRELDLSGNHLTFRSIPHLGSLPSLTHLDLSRNFLDNFFIALPSTFSYPLLEYLSLRSTNMSSVPTPIFPALPRLRTLDLSYNFFPEITGKSFLGASPKLQSLSLSHCRIRTLTADAWIPLSNLVTFEVSSNFLANGSDLLNFPKSLTSLYIAKNKLTALPDLRFAMANLMELDASDNLLTKVELNTLPASTLRRLDLRGNLLTSIPAFTEVNNTGRNSDFLGTVGWMMAVSTDGSEKVNRTARIEVLDLSWNRIVDVAKPVTGLANLIELDLSGNRISMLPTGFLKDFELLERVNLSRNLLAGLDNATFHSLPVLKTLDLGYNKLKAFDFDALNDVPNLLTLRLDSNSLSGFAPGNSFSSFPVLERLDLAKNSLTNVSSDTFSSATLRQLDLSNNHLSSLSNTSFGTIPLLRTLNLHGNTISKLTSGVFWSVPQLQVLDLSRNNLHQLPEDLFRGLRRLSLNLSRNKLETLPFEIFSKPRIDRLEELNLAGNRLSTFPDKTLSEQDYNLITLNLAENQISDIPAGCLISTKNVDLSFNPLSEQATGIVLSDPKTTFSLNMAGVGLTNFPSVQLQFLTNLNLSNNNLVTFGDPLNWQRATLLESVDLSNNQLTDLRDSRLVWVLPKLAFLKRLDLSRNSLKVIRENELAGLINVDYLDVSNLTSLETFDISNFLEFPRLRTLKAATYPRLANFPIGDISAQLPALRSITVELKYPILTSQLQGMLTPSLQSLALTGPIVTRVTRDTFGVFNPGEEFHLDLNNLAVNSLPADIFQRFPRATHLDLAVKNTNLGGTDIAGLVQNLDFLDGTEFSFVGNRLDCTCNASSAMSVWMSIRGSVRDVQCDTPSEMSGQSVLEIDFTDLPCQPPAADGSSLPPPPPPRGNRLLRPPPAGRFNEGVQDNDEPIQPTEADVIFEVTSTRAAVVQTTTQGPTISHIEGAVAGIVVGLLVLTGLMIAAIVFWFRRERNRQSQLKSAPRDFIPPDAPYAVIPNTDVVPHPTWYPPPQPVLILPGRNTPSGKSGRFIPPDYPQFDHGGYFERGLYDVPFPEARSENASRVMHMDGDFSDYARTSYAGKSIIGEEPDKRSEHSFTAESCDMTFTFESVFSPSVHNDGDEKGQAGDSVSTVEKS